MVCRHQFFADALAQMERDPFRQSPGVHEHQGGAVLENQGRDAVVDLAPHLIAGDRAEFGWRDFNGEVELAPVSDVDDGRSRACRAGQEMSDQLNRLLRRRQPNSRGMFGQPVKAFQR